VVTVNASRSSEWRAQRPSVVGSAIILALVLAVAALVLLQARPQGPGTSAPVGPWPLPRSHAGVDIGVVTLPLAQNSWRAWTRPDLETVNAFEHAIHKHVGVVMWYADWAHRAPLLRQLQAVGRRHSIPEITWEPWNSVRAVTVQPGYTLRRIIAGDFDSYIRSWASTMAAYGKPVRLRFAQEMNGSWYPWAEVANGNAAHQYVQAWRRIHDLFVAAGATNVQWVWSPAAITIPSEQYPGNAYVDIVSLSVFNGGSQLRFSPWRPLSALLARPLARLHAIAPSKPIELSEVGCAPQGGDKAAWIANLFATVHRHPAIRSLIWYDLVKGSDWRVESSPAAAAAFATAVAGPRYQ
jgi:hypothetical protein